MKPFLVGSLITIILLSGLIFSQLSLNLGSSLLAAVSSSHELKATCYATQAEGIQPGETVEWYVKASGGRGTYTYVWTGTDGLWSDKHYAQKKYETEGLKSATVTVLSGSESKTIVCGSIRIQYTPLRGSCDVEFEASNDRITINWGVDVQGGNGEYSYIWTGTDGMWGNSDYVSFEYPSGGEKIGTVTTISGNQSLTLTCKAHIPEVYDLSRQPTVFGCTILAYDYSTNEEIIWQAIEDGTKHYSRYRWSGSNELESRDSEEDIRYRVKGVKHASVTARVDGKTVGAQCQAYVADKGEIYTGTRVTKYNPNQEHRSTEGCFIATAAYGSDMEPHVETLRNFRDSILLTNEIGTTLVHTYYKISPPIADAISENNLAKALVRSTLKPIIDIADISLKIVK